MRRCRGRSSTWTGIEARSLALSLGRTVRDARRRIRWSQAQLAAKVGLKRTRIGDIERGEATGTPLVAWVRLGIALRRPIAISFSRDLEAMAPSDAGHLEGQELVLRLAREASTDGHLRATDASREPFLLRRCLRARRPEPNADPPGDLEPLRRLRPRGPLNGPQDRRSRRARRGDRRRQPISGGILLAPRR